MRPGEIRLALGLVCVIAGAALAQFVLVGLVGLALLTVAFFVLIRAGVLLASDHRPSPTRRHIAGYVVYCVGVMPLVGFAYHECFLAHCEVLLLQRGIGATPDFSWPLLFARSAAITTIIIVGLSMATSMSWLRLLVWALPFGSMSAWAVLLFRLLAPSLPISA